MKPDIIITFDGGTTCNIPRLGFGEGYGSYQINDRDVVRCRFGIGHSCNSAELLTLTFALRDLLGSDSLSSLKHVHVKGDSQIALKWAKHRGFPSKKSTPMFHSAIAMLRREASSFRNLTTEWWPRENSVRIFGH